MKRIERIAIGVVMAALLMMCAINSLTIHEQQKTLDTTIDTMAAMNGDDTLAQSRIWDLHRRVTRLETEAKRLHQHIKWFVMRRSGTNELRKMEAAIKHLEERHVAGD